MNSEIKIVIIVAVILLICFIKKLIDLYYRRPSRTRKLRLSNKVKSKADRKYAKLYNRFRYKNKREPDNNEKFRIAINASHITIRHRGYKGHWGRQKVRKHLLEKNNVVDDYKMK